MVSGLGYRGHGAHCELRICAPAVEEVDHLVRVRARVRVRVRLRVRVRVGVRVRVRVRRRSP